MIPKLIQRKGAQHLAEEEAAQILSADRPRDILGLIPDRSVLELIPESVCRENLVIPLRLDGETLYVAAVDPNFIPLADKLSFLLNKKVRLVGLPGADIQAAINQHFGSGRTESVSSMLTEFADTAIEFTRTEAAARRR